MSNSRGPETLADLIGKLGARARAVPPVEAARAGDWWSRQFRSTATSNSRAEAVAGKIVIDTMNYYSQRDGRIDELEERALTVATVGQSTIGNEPSTRPPGLFLTGGPSPQTKPVGTFSFSVF